MMGPEFTTHRLNDQGTQKARYARLLFDQLLEHLVCAGNRLLVPGACRAPIPTNAPGSEGSYECGKPAVFHSSMGWLGPICQDHLSPALPQGRYLSLVKTKLEEACMFALRAIESDPANQLPDVGEPIGKQKETDAALRGWVNRNFKHDAAPKPFTGVATKIEGRDAVLNVDLPATLPGITGDEAREAVEHFKVGDGVDFHAVASHLREAAASKSVADALAEEGKQIDRLAMNRALRSRFMELAELARIESAIIQDWLDYGFKRGLTPPQLRNWSKAAEEEIK